MDFKKDLSMLATVGAYIDYISELFESSDLYYGHGTDSAWDEAVQLVLFSLKLPLDSGDSVLPRVISESKKKEIILAVESRVVKRIPLPYILNQAWFMQLPFYVDQRVLIPRSPFHELIMNLFYPWVTDSDAVSSVLEIGTGSGCMSIALATQLPLSSITATDISLDALDVAKKNVINYDLSDQISLLHSDIYENVTGSFDLIISNPPYVGDNEMSTLPQEYLHEPVSALRADNDGLALVKTIIEGAHSRLNEKGLLVVEVGNSQEALVSLYPDLPFIWCDFECGGHGVFVLNKADLVNLERG
jgi:ribosomal protein L3 glutamine methyltransferase